MTSSASGCTGTRRAQLDLAADEVDLLAEHAWMPQPEGRVPL